MQDHEILEIADLEYDVGATNAIEATDGKDTTETWVIYYVPPV